MIILYDLVLISMKNDKLIEKKDLIHRDYKFDIIKTFLIFCVVLGHFLQQCIKNNESVDLFIKVGYYFIYSFHMPAFMFISGWFCYGKTISTTKYIKDTLLYLLIPLILWDLILATIDYFDGVFYGIQSIIVSLWYIKALIIIRIIAFPFLKKPSIFRGSIIILVGILFGKYYLLSILIPSFFIGYMSNKYHLLDKCWITIFSTVVFLIEIIIHPNLDSVNYFFFQKMYWNNWWNFFNRLILGLSGAVSIISLIRFLSSSNINSLIHIVRVTLGIYIIQSIIAERFFCKSLSQANNIFIYLVFSVFTIIISYMIIFMIKKLSFSKFIIGR